MANSTNWLDLRCPRCKVSEPVAHKHRDGSWRVPSNTRFQYMHRVSVALDGDWHCTCEGRYGRCKHVSKVQALEAIGATEEPRTKMNIHPVPIETPYDLFGGDELEIEQTAHEDTPIAAPSYGRVLDFPTTKQDADHSGKSKLELIFDRLA